MKKYIRNLVFLAVLLVSLFILLPFSTQAQTTTSPSCPAGFTCTPVPCPEGFTCTPLVTPNDNCPDGYICEPTRTTNTSNVPCYDFKRNLTVGSEGEDVSDLQRFLIAKGYNTVVAGIFGSRTLGALMEYQEDSGLPATGFFGPLTIAKVQSDCDPKVETNKVQIGTTLVSTDTGAYTSTSGDIGLFVIKYKITAVGGDVYVSSLANIAGLSYVIDRAGVALSSNRITATLVNNDDAELSYTGNYEIQEGETKTFTLSISVPADKAAQYRASLISINWDSVDKARLSNTYIVGDDYKTAYKVLNGSGVSLDNPIKVQLVSTDTELNSGKNNEGKFEIKFKVTATDSDIYLPPLSSGNYKRTIDRSGVAINDFNVMFGLANITDTSKTSAGNYKISKGDTETFTYSAWLPVSETGQYRLTLNSIKWDTRDDSSADYTYETNFKTNYLVLVGSTTSQTPSIKVLSPNGGEILTLGHTYVVENSYLDFYRQPMVNYSLYKGNTRLGYLHGTSIIGDKTFKWDIGKYEDSNQVIRTVEPGSNYKIRIYTSLGTEDFSDNYFTIISPSASPSPTPTNTSISEAKLTALCYSTPSAPKVGDTVNWQVAQSGGASPYKYSWTGSDNLYSGYSLAQKIYSTAGKKTAKVVIKTPQQSLTAECSTNVYVAPTVTSSPISTYSPTPTTTYSPASTYSPTPTTTSSATPSSTPTPVSTYTSSPTPTTTSSPSSSPRSDIPSSRASIIDAFKTLLGI